MSVQSEKRVAPPELPGGWTVCKTENGWKLVHPDRPTPYCRNCKSTSVSIAKEPDGVRGELLRCVDCGFSTWNPLDKNWIAREKRPKCARAAELGIDYCQMCLFPEKHLPSSQQLEVHHIDDDAANNDRTNLMVVCTPCHKKIHHERVYRTKHFLDWLTSEDDGLAKEE